MQLERLRLFAELVNKGSFTQAAEYLGISKAHLSKQLKLLENELGTQLLIRNTRSMRLTSAGANLYTQANKLTSFWHDSKQLLDISESLLAGEVKFTAPTGLLKYDLLPLISELSEQQPDINITAETGNETFNLVTTPYDFAIRITNTPPEEVVARKLTQFEYTCCATPQYLVKYGTPTSPKELLQRSCISLSYWKNWQFAQNNQTFDINVPARYQFSNNEVIKQAGLDSLGICRLPSYMVKDELKSGQLLALFPQYEAEKKDIYILYTQSIKRAERVNLVIEAIKQHYIS